jgi:hypothetical protein
LAKIKPLNVKQLAVIDDLFKDKIEQSGILKNHNLSRKLFEKWLADESFLDHLDRRMAWEYRRGEIMLARSVSKAVSNLMKLTESSQTETARKACLDIITMRTNLSAGVQASNDNPKPPAESLPFSHETAGKMLAFLTEEKTLNLS